MKKKSVKILKAIRQHSHQSCSFPSIKYNIQNCVLSGLEVIKVEFILKLKVKRNDCALF